jgi:hypothetical protein
MGSRWFLSDCRVKIVQLVMQDIKLRSVSFRCHTLSLLPSQSTHISIYVLCLTRNNLATSSCGELRHFWVCCNKDSLCLQDGATISSYDVAATRMASIVAMNESDIMMIQTNLTSAQKSCISFWRPPLTRLLTAAVCYALDWRSLWPRAVLCLAPWMKRLNAQDAKKVKCHEAMRGSGGTAPLILNSSFRRLLDLPLTLLSVDS